MAGLTRRQLQLIARYLELESIAAIAKAEGLSETTVRNQLSRAYHTLNTRSLLSAAWELGWIQVPPNIYRGRGRARVIDRQLKPIPRVPPLPAAPLSAGSLTGFGLHGLRDGAGLYNVLGDEIDLVVDVRLKRRSRMREFSTMTQATVEGAGYEYRWLRGLGNTGDGERMRLADPTQVEVVISELRAGHNVAVMCLCSDVRICHRGLVIELARKAIPGLDVREA